MRTTRAGLRAIALEYGDRPAPVVVAKAEEAAGRLLIEEARRLGIHVARDPALAAALSRLRTGDEIPEELYVMVAVVLSWAYWLEGLRPGETRRRGSDQASL